MRKGERDFGELKSEEDFVWLLAEESFERVRVEVFKNYCLGWFWKAQGPGGFGELNGAVRT